MDKSPPKTTDKHARFKFYGRRRGRRLRPRHEAVLAEGLERFGLSSANLSGGGLSGGGIDCKTDPRVWFSEPPLSESPLSESPMRLFLEIGFGGGEHLAARARARPPANLRYGFIGAEPFRNGVARLCRYAIDEGLENIRIWPDDVRLLLPSLSDGCFDGIFILFPDPWPKEKHRHRRLIQPELLDVLARLLRGGGFLLLASDEVRAQSWILEQMMRRPEFRWTASSASDWRLPPSAWPEGLSGTRYMVKAARAARPSAWFHFIKEA